MTSFTGFFSITRLISNIYAPGCRVEAFFGNQKLDSIARRHWFSGIFPCFSLFFGKIVAPFWKTLPVVDRTGSLMCGVWERIEFPAITRPVVVRQTLYFFPFSKYNNIPTPKKYCACAMNLDDLLPQTCPWLLGNGEESDIVLSCRIRLARNLAGYPFPIRATEQDRRLVCDVVRQAAAKLFIEDEYHFADVQTLSALDREYLFERQLISREFVEAERTHAALIDRKERFCVMVNEEDHLRIHATGSGLAPQTIWKQVNQVDDQLGSKLDYVFHQKYGFLTSCVTNAGTGMRVSAMLHLPALVVTNEMDKVARSLQKANLTVRGLYGEGSKILGDLYQISNRITLGKSEEELIVKMTDLIPQIVAYERKAREFLIKERREIIFDRCSRAVGVLRTARTIDNIETIHHLSSLRLGIHTGLLEGIALSTVNSLLLFTQPAHLQKMQGTALSQADQDVVRATYIRQAIGR